MYQSSGALPLARPSDATIDPRVLIVAGRDEPVFDWAAFEFVKLPPEYILVKRLHRFRIVGVNFKVSNAIHGFSSFVCCLILVVTLHPIHREIEMILVTTFKRACASLTRSRTPLRA